MIKLNGKIPEMMVRIVIDGQKQEISSTELFGGKTVLFGLPGAFTPICSKTQLPDFAKKEADLRSKGYQKIICMAVNDAFVMQAWKEQVAPDANIIMLADGSAAFTKALGVESDLSEKHMGLRCQRFLMVAENSIVSMLNVEDDSAVCTVSSVDSLL